jgi:hypothetical protein
MAYPESSFLFLSLSVIQIAGLASAWLARMSEGSSHQAPFQWLFFALLAVVGATTMGSIAVGTGWLASGGTLSIMVLAAIWDFRVHAPRHAMSSQSM